MFNPFDYPEIKELLKVLLDNLLSESGRGALLIATAHVDEHLTKLLEASIVQNLSKNQKERLFRYPGPLSSFSAKIELSYAFRLIDENLYTSLNALRKIRNDAAHSSKSFELHELREQMKNVYSLGPSLPSFIQEMSTRVMMEFKMEAIKQSFEKSELKYEDWEETVRELLKDKKRQEELEKQVPFWELIYGLCLLCSLIIYL